MSARRKKEKFYVVDNRPEILAKNFTQKEYIRAIFENDMVCVMGPAGTGKTYIAATLASRMYFDGEINKIVLTRPNVSASESLGFFPGTLTEKMAPWVAPFTDVIRQQLGEGTYDTMLKNGNLEIAPFETMRGRSFNDAFVILDEAQNTSPKEMEMFVTRVGDNSRVIINGDIMQSDIMGSNGLHKVLQLINKLSLPVPIIEFHVEDIVRSPLCKMWIEAFMEDTQYN
ncbi:MAG: PhoH family protein [Cycloclasticus sp.]|jgi:phosphate starvation-inducible PhoH-like protein|nr:PhoH family protein [Cycloclasticus sp.]MEE4290286.1 PhoH family protein [Cycloclasticus sp.]